LVKLPSETKAREGARFRHLAALGTVALLGSDDEAGRVNRYPLAIAKSKSPAG